MIVKNGRGGIINKSYLKKVTFILLIFIIFLLILPQKIAYEPPETEWDIAFGGEGYDTALQLIQTRDKGYSIAGLTGSFNATGHDCWLIKMSQNGTIEWHRYYGGEGDDVGNALLQTEDEGYLVTGFVTTLEGDYDVLLIKTDTDGNYEWWKTYGGAGEDQATSIINNSEGGYILAGYTNINKFKYDALLIKTDFSGNEIWNKTYGGSGFEKIWSLIQTVDGGFALAGYTDSFGSGGYDYWLVKTDSNGTMEWNRTFGGKDDDVARSLIQMDNGGFAIAGYSEIVFYYDFLLVKTNYQGYMEWSKNYSGPGDIFSLSAIQTDDKGFALGGHLYYDIDKTLFYMIKTNKITSDVYNLFPVAYAGEDIIVNIDENVTFIGNGYDSDGEIINYRWDFNGDGIYDYSSNHSDLVTYIYNEEGTYNAILEITDNNGSTSTDMKKIVILSSCDRLDLEKANQNIFVIIFGLLIILITSIVYLLLRNKKIIKLFNSRNFKFLHLFTKMEKWSQYLIISYFFMVGIKFTISYLVTNPWIVGDEFIYGVIAGDIFQGDLMILGSTPFASASPPAGYSYFLAPAYLVGNNIDHVYYGMLFINSLLSAFVIFPVFFIMKMFVNKKLSFITAIIIAVLPTIITHNYLLLSENAFYPMILISCYFLIKTFTYRNFNKKFIAFALLLGISVGFIIMIRAMGIAMLGALICVFIYKLVKEKKISSFRYGLIFLPFLPVVGYLLLKGSSSLLGYSGSYYFESLNLILSDPSSLTRFLGLMLNEISYFVLMSYFILFAFFIFLLMFWKKIPREKKEVISAFSIYGILSIFFLIIITSLHMLKGKYELYTRYVNPALPIIFMLGIIGMFIYQKSKDKKASLSLISIFILVGLFFIFVFPTDGIKLVNSLDVGWIIRANNHLFFSISLANWFKIFIAGLFIIIVFLIRFRKTFNKYLLLQKISQKKINVLLIIIICLSIIISISSISEVSYGSKIANDMGIYEPAHWLMHNDPDANIVLEGYFDAHSGGGIMELDYRTLFASLYFWSPGVYIEGTSRNNLSKLVTSSDLNNTDYILSTHDLTEYYPVVESFYMNIPVSLVKSQNKVDWHIYKIK